MSTLEARFFSKVQSTGECWAWQGKPNQNGYGRFCSGAQRYTLAHRWAYELLIDEIPPGLVLDHLCRNKLCVNPWHLDPVTQRVNALRGRLWESEKTHCPARHPYSEINTYITPDGHRECRTCRRAADKRRRDKRRLAA